MAQTLPWEGPTRGPTARAECGRGCRGGGTGV